MAQHDAAKNEAASTKATDALLAPFAHWTPMVCSTCALAGTVQRATGAVPCWSCKDKGVRLAGVWADDVVWKPTAADIKSMPGYAVPQKNIYTLFAEAWLSKAEMALLQVAPSGRTRHAHSLQQLPSDRSRARARQPQTTL
jgi:hypothetical protein